MSNAPGGATAPTTTASTAGAPAPAPAAPSAGSSGPAASPAAPSRALGPAVPANGKPGAQAAAEQAAKLLYKHKRQDGTEEDIDISGYEHELTINGEKRKMPLSEMARLVQLERASFKRFKEAAELKQAVESQRKQLETVAQRLKDPQAVLKHLRAIAGEQFNQLIESAMVERLRYEKLPPNERARLDEMRRREAEFERRERQLAERDAQIKAQETKIRQAKAQEQARKWAAEWPEQLAALGIPKSEKAMGWAMQETRRILREAAQYNVPMSIAQAQRNAVDAYRDLVGGTLRGADPATIRALAGDDVLERVAKVHQDALQAQPGRQVPEQQPEAVRNGRPAKILRPDDFR